MEKYTIKKAPICDEIKNVIESDGKFFAGYDFMGSVNWVNDILSAYYMTQDEADSIKADLEASDSSDYTVECKINVNCKMVMVYMVRCESVEIMITRDPFSGDWEIYYRKDKYPLTFAFGLCNNMKLEDVVKIAVANVYTDNCKLLFEEE